MNDTDSTLFLEADVISELPPDALARLHDEMSYRDYDTGDFLIRQGDVGDELLLIASGTVEIQTEDTEGRNYVIGQVGRGEVLGEMALLAREPRSAHAIARSAVTARALPAETFHALLEEHSEFSELLTHLIALRVGGDGRDVLVGREMDGYRIGHRLGRGGMAVVYEASRIDSSETVALKMMSHRLVCDQRSRDLFQQEADIIESFDHPNIGQMLGRFEMFHTYFIVVEFIDGVTLHDLMINQGALSETQLRASLGQLARAVDYAHSSQVIHRDIKPGNVMINSSGQVKLMDFGLAKPLGPQDSPDRILVGTPGYMAPEQFVEAAPEQGIDIFALGCLAYELLTGSKLFPQQLVTEFVQAIGEWKGLDASLLPPGTSEEFTEVLQGWLTADPNQRPSQFERVCSWAQDVEIPDSVMTATEILDPDAVTQTLPDDQDTQVEDDDTVVDDARTQMLEDDTRADDHENG